MATASPGSIRPGGRTMRVQAAVFDATLSVLAESGYSGLSIERIAERSGVNKTTIYRRWQAKDALVAAALDENAAEVFPIPATESIADDLRAFGRGLADFLTDDSPSIAGVQRALFSDAAREPLIAELKRSFFARRHEAAASMVDAAIDRGELPGDIDSRELVGLVAAQLYYRKLATGETIDHAVADRAAATALVAAQAGACRRR